MDCFAVMGLANLPFAMVAIKQAYLVSCPLSVTVCSHIISFRYRRHPFE